MIPNLRSLRLRILLTLGLIFLLTFSLTSVTTFFRVQDVLVTRVFQMLQNIKGMTAQELDRWVRQRKTEVTLWSRLLAQVLAQDSVSWKPFWEELEAQVQKRPDFQSLVLLHPVSGRVLAGARKDPHRTLEATEAFRLGQMDLYQSGIHPSPQTLEPIFTLAHPVELQGKTFGILVLELNLQDLQLIFRAQVKTQSQGQIYLVDSLGSFLTGAGGDMPDFSKALKSPGIQAAVRGEGGQGIYENYLGESVAGSYLWLPQLDCGLLNEIPSQQAFKPAGDLGRELFLGFLVISLGALAGISWAVARITAPILRLKTAVEKVAGGDWTVTALAPSRDEVGALAQGFNRMVAQLSQYYSQLESRMAHRTQELSSTREVLQDTQTHLAEVEKMALLGQLTAGVAHELNSPLGALISASQSLVEDLQNLRQVHEGLPGPLPPELRDLEAAVETYFRQPGPGEASSRNHFRTQKEILDHWQGTPLEGRRDLAEVLARWGIPWDLKPVTLGLSAPQGADLLKNLDKFYQARQSLEVIALAAERSAHIVRALKTYSHPAAARWVPVDLASSLDQALTLNQNAFRRGIELAKELEPDLPPVEADPQALTQVWINLIQNALQAMEGQGTLTVGLRGSPAGAEVWVQDTGPGIPSEHLGRIFEPFFTTKPRGQGTGLGLDLIKQAVEGHQGTILVDSHLGKGTRFTVFLPWKRVPHES